jgi:hypothetical protein
MLQSFPLLALSFVIYAVITLLSGPTPPGQAPWYQHEWRTIHLNSGDSWQISNGDLFIGFTFVLFFIELLRSTRSSKASIMNHGLSVLVFVGALLMFTATKGYGNSIFFMFTVMTFTDFLVGFIITTATARRDVAIGRASE